MYNQFVATHRFKGKTSKDSPSTAGMGKVSAGGSKGREELKSLGERMGWTSRELTMREIQQMSADETLWHEAFNKDNFERAFERDAIAKHNHAAMAVWDIRKAWREGVTNEDTEKARIAGDQFATRFPQFERSLPNAELMVAYMRDNDLDATKTESYVTAYRELNAAGKLTLAEAKSADTFLEEHPELNDKRVPPLIAARHQREQNTAAHFAAASAATNESSVTRVVDFGPQKHGIPPESEKYSFRMKVRAMSADQIARRCADDPAFKAALDALG